MHNAYNDKWLRNKYSGIFFLCAAKKKNQIIACGGGIVIDQDNIKLMKNSGTMICLSATPDVILERTRKSNHRPILNVPDPQEAIRALLADRQQLYAQADITIDTSEISIKEVVDALRKYLQDNLL